LVAADGGRSGMQPGRREAGRPFALRTARGAYASFHLVVSLPRPGAYELALEFEDPSRRLAVDLFREWFHRLEAGRGYYPDALVPVANPHRGALPEPDNRIDGQRAQGFWADVWIPAEAAPGSYRGRATLRAGAEQSRVDLELRVLPAVVP